MNENGKRNKKGRGASSRKRNSANRNQRPLKKDDRFDESANKGATSASNNPDWYGAGSELTRAAATLSFSQPMGRSVEVTSQLPEAPLFNFFPKGIMQLTAMPTFGNLKKWDDPYNVAVRAVYSFIRYTNSGHTNYDAPDLGMYFMAYDSCLTYYAWMVRAYGTLRTIVLKNNYYPVSMVQAMGLDYTNLVSNMANFKFYIDTYATRLNALRCPKTMDLFQRHMWLYSNIYLDAPNTKAQAYIVVPAGFWIFNQGSTPDDTGMFVSEGPAFGGNGRFWQLTDIITNGDKMLNSVLNNQDFNIMSGDIQKAFGDNVWAINAVDANYTVQPTYDPEFLLQVHNATVLFADVDDWDIKEDVTETDNAGSMVMGAPMTVSKYVAQTPAQDRFGIYAMYNKILDVPVENPDPSIVSIATRFMCAATLGGVNWPGTTSATMELDVCGSEVITGAWIVKTESSSKSMAFTAITNTSDLEVFGSHPLTPVVTLNGQQKMAVTNLIGDIDNFTLVEYNTLDNIQRAAVLALVGLNKK